MASVIPLTVACQRDSANDVKSLDNFAQGSDLTLHQCEVPRGGGFHHPKAPRTIADASSQERDELDRVFSAALATVPKKIQDAFFDAPNFGRIEFYDDLSGRCIPDEFAKLAESMPQGRQEDSIGCWVRNPEPIIRLKKDPATLRYATLRAFGYVWAELQSSYEFTDDKTQPIRLSATGDALHNSFKQSLAIAFLQDIDTDPAGKGYSLERFQNTGLPETLLKSYRSEDALSASRGRSAAWQEWQRTQPAAASDFATRVAVDAFHSRLCNSSTQQALSQAFPTVAGILSLADADIGLTRSEAPRLTKGASALACGYLCRNQARIARYDQDDYQHAQRTFYNQVKATLNEREQSEQGDSLNLFGNGQLSSILGGLLQLLFGGLQTPNTNLLGGGGGSWTPPTNANAGNGGLFDQPPGPGTSRGGGNLPNSNDSSARPAPSTAGTLTGGSGDAQIVLQKTNQYRQQAGLSPLTLDDQLSGGCVTQAQRQVQCGKMEHLLSANCQGNSQSEWGGANAENIASGQTSAEQVSNSWFNSPGHKANMLNSGFSRLGVGRVNNEWCQRFR